MKKRFLATLLCLCMVLSLMPTAAFAAGESGIQLGTSGVADKDFVYFGNYNSADIKWKVLDANADNASGTNAMFLLSEYLLVQNNKPFDADSNVCYSNRWSYCAIGVTNEAA